MLNPEMAKEQLAKFKSTRFVDERLQRVAGLPQAIRGDARRLFYLEEPKKQEAQDYYDQYQTQRKSALEAYRALSGKQIDQLIVAVFPELSKYILRAMALLERLPYTDGYGRKPFRAIKQPDFYATRRMDFLMSVFSSLKEYPPDVEWIAAWAAYAWPYNDFFVGPLLAAAIDEDDVIGKRVFDILLASAKGEHEVGQMGRHVVRSFLFCQRTDAWEFIEKMLLAAQREEGLRQSILELVDEGHPDVFPRFLKVALEHDLVRFSATVRAVDVWFGFAWDAMSVGKARQIMEHALKFLEDPIAGDVAIDIARELPDKSRKRPTGKKLIEAHEAVEPAYIALWCKAFVDVGLVFKPAGELLKSADADVRFVATHLLCQLGLVDSVSKMIAGMLDDPDERVAARALSHFNRQRGYDRDSHDKSVPDLFERLEKLMARTPAKTIKLAPIVWPWMALDWGKETAGHAMVSAIGERPATVLLPHLDAFDPRTRWEAVNKLGALQENAAVRETLVALAGDASRQVRDAALSHIRKMKISADEAPRLEKLLSRKAADLRRAVIQLLLSQDDAAALASIDRLVATKDVQSRIAGLELIRQLTAADRSAVDCLARAQAYRAEHKTPLAEERTQLDAVEQPAHDLATLQDCLGLIDPSMRTPPLQPSPHDVRCVTPAAIALLKGLDDLVHEHREKTLIPHSHSGKEGEPILLGNARWEFPRVDRDKPIAEQMTMLQHRDIWLAWFENRAAAVRDMDGFELVRAEWLMMSSRNFHDERVPKDHWLKPIEERLLGKEKIDLRYPGVVVALLPWLDRIYPSPRPASFLLDALEDALSRLPKDKLTETRKAPWGAMEYLPWRESCMAISDLVSLISTYSHQLASIEKVRFYGLCRWIDEPGVPVPRSRPDLDRLLDALDAGGAKEVDIYDHFLGPRDADPHAYRAHSEMGQYSSLKPHPSLRNHAALGPVIERCRKRVLEIELKRGETPTIVSNFAASLNFSGGMDVLLSFMSAADKNTFVRGFTYANLSKPVVFSKVIRATFPADSDTPPAFVQAAKELKISTARWLELAVYAPQWADHVAAVLGWPDLPGAIWWIPAHTRDRGWSVETELRERWKAQVARRTPLEAEDLLDGAVDVAWFHRTYEQLGKKRWQAVYDVAKFAASGGGHKRAQLFADAMLGHTKAKELLERIETKRHQDAVRALGLVPLPTGDKAKPQVLSRYKALQEFIRTSRQFGSQRQASEKRAGAIGMENLARTAGYPDPVRLQWAMEAQTCEDLAKGPVTVSAANVAVSLSIDADGEPHIECRKGDKPLAAIPAVAKKNSDIAELASRRTDLKRSRSRMRDSLEQAMVRGDNFRGDELFDLAKNPLLWPMLGRLVFVGEGIMGYPVDGGRGLADHSGKIEPVKKSEQLRLAHPHDLLQGKQWTQWQHDCFAAERVQPFKQVFRELYLLTQTELDAKDQSRRYAGHQAQPKQALALLGSRGWVVSYEEGVSKTFHDAGITAFLTFLQPFFTPADIEGLTLESVRFTSRKSLFEWEHLSAIPPRLFSEVMRDLDLVVSVAHRGGVDPEASASTIQMRSALLDETLQLLRLNNVRVKDNHALIKGKLAEYTVHLGSGIAHRQPGGALFIVPVHSQHRGRIFLPFADDDPKTAEVMSKVLLLARDSEMRDPNLLAQIRA